jgi:hypothetical protein
MPFELKPTPSLSWLYPSEHELRVCSLDELLTALKATGIKINVRPSRTVEQGQCVSLDDGRTWVINEADFEQLKADAERGV